MCCGSRGVWNRAGIQYLLIEGERERGREEAGRQEELVQMH